jgi:hypothetical protein
MSPGPLTARLYLRLLALVSLVAWLSIGVQLRLLIGAHGLLPIARLLDEARAQGVSFFAFPTLFWLGASDTALSAAVALGAAASLYGTIRPGRIWLAFSLPLYLSVSIAAQDFCAFQWDYLLVEASFLALFLDPRRPSRAAILLPRLLLFKLYFESGLSKLLSPVGDWTSGSAMVSYFETAPIPTSLGRVFHALPLGVLHGISWATLVVELGVPCLAFGPRLARRVAFVVLGGFQLVNFLTANYGFFVPLSMILHIWLLDDETLARLRLGRLLSSEPPTRLARRVALAALIGWSTLSLGEARLAFGDEPPEGSLRARFYDAFVAARAAWAPWRVADVYHLFASVTTQRDEVILDVKEQPEGPWRELVFRYKPGPLDRPAPYIAPHQPRVDFSLWFHGLNPRGRLPLYLLRLQHALCVSPDRVAPLFVSPPPAHAAAVRVRYARYRMTPLGAAQPWSREDLFARPTMRCDNQQRSEEARR